MNRNRMFLVERAAIPPYSLIHAEHKGKHLARNVFIIAAENIYNLLFG